MILGRLRKPVATASGATNAPARDGRRTAGTAVGTTTAARVVIVLQRQQTVRVGQRQEGKQLLRHRQICRSRRGTVTSASSQRALHWAAACVALGRVQWQWGEV